MYQPAILPATAKSLAWYHVFNVIKKSNYCRSFNPLITKAPDLVLKSDTDWGFFIVRR